MMRHYEYIGTLIAVVAYLNIVAGVLTTGFVLGVLASSLLALYFVSIKSYASMGLQFFFICANIFGIVNLGAF